MPYPESDCFPETLVLPFSYSVGLIFKELTFPAICSLTVRGGCILAIPNDPNRISSVARNFGYPPPPLPLRVVINPKTQAYEADCQPPVIPPPRRVVGPDHTHDRIKK